MRSTERVRTVSPSRLTSVLATVLCGVGCWFLLLVGVFLLWFFLSCCVSFLASAPYAPSSLVMMSQVIVNGHLTFFWDAVPLVLLF